MATSNLLPAPAHCTSCFSFTSCRNCPRALLPTHRAIGAGKMGELTETSLSLGKQGAQPFLKMWGGPELSRGPLALETPGPWSWLRRYHPAHCVRETGALSPLDQPCCSVEPCKVAASLSLPPRELAAVNPLPDVPTAGKDSVCMGPGGSPSRSTGPACLGCWEWGSEAL